MVTDREVLNPLLFRRMRQYLGRVDVSRQGEEMIARTVTNLAGKPELLIQHAGESYKANCPFCGDRRKRLWLSYRYGQKDDIGRRLDFLAVCFNETACLHNYENRQKLWETLSGGENLLPQAVLRPGRQVPKPSREVPWPGPCTRLDELPDNHKAKVYLRSRNLDPDLLGRVYQASYCHDSHYYLAADRIIAPAFDDGLLKGWQSRYIGELDWKGPNKKELPPKYFTLPDMPKSELFYNWDQAKRYQSCAVVEGFVDVWAFGPMACATFGVSLSYTQKRRLCAVFNRPGRSAVLLWDPEAFAEEYVQEAIQELDERMNRTRGDGRRFAAVRLPDGTDPGSLDYRFSRAYAVRLARQQGVTVNFTRLAKAGVKI